MAAYENVFMKQRKIKIYKEIQFYIKVWLSIPPKNCVIYFIESPLKMTKSNLFYFILKAHFVHKTFKILSWLFGHVRKTAWLERQG